MMGDEFKSCLPENSKRPFGVELYEREKISLSDPRWQARQGVLLHINQLEQAIKRIEEKQKHLKDARNAGYHEYGGFIAELDKAITAAGELVE